MKNITIKILHTTPMPVVLEALKKPYKNENVTEELFKKVVKVNKHESVMEHLTFNIEIDGISRLCLQELARHRIASLTVRSTRFTLQELITDEEPDLEEYFVFPLDLSFAEKQIYSDMLLDTVCNMQKFEGSNDYVKYLLPESFRTSLVWTVNARSLSNFLFLRLSKKAHFEIRYLANLIKKELSDCEIF